MKNFTSLLCYFQASSFKNVFRNTVILLFVIHYSIFTADAQDLWGMTSSGGANNLGVIFEYNPSTGIYNHWDFTGGNGTLFPGSYPAGSLLYVKDAQNNEHLYGMTEFGGFSNSSCQGSGCGVLFDFDITNRLSPIYSVKVQFDGTNGANPHGSLILASDGNLYGMTYSGGDNGDGVIFQYTPGASSVNVKYSFDASNNGAIDPIGSLMQATDGNLYGMTSHGGDPTSACDGGCGVIFKYTPGATTITPVVLFNNTNGEEPHGSLIQATNGLMYGMTLEGGDVHTVSV